MGCRGAKSLIPIYDSRNFLDIIYDQIHAYRRQYNLSIPFLLMNSYRTEADTAAYVKNLSDQECRSF